MKLGIFVGVELFLLSECRGKFSNTANKGLSLPFNDVAVHLKEWIIKLIVITINWSLGGDLFIAINHLTHFKIISFEYKAIARNVCSGLKKYDISDNEVPDTDTLSGTELASNDSYCFLLDQRLKTNKSFILDPISQGGDSDKDNSRYDDRESLNESS